EGRAMAAAEAAIANPLLDETSMRGARGLLISITGGRDLTLFEVDEAATRIREEVDQDANIILGATFDESLEGVIRVSVVATGIDKASVEMSASPLRQPAKPIAQKPQTPIEIRSSAPVAPTPRPVEALRAETKAHDPIAEAIRAADHNANAMSGDAGQDSFQPRSNIFQPVASEAPLRAHQPVAAAPQVAQPQASQPRMPRVEDFPPAVRAGLDPQHARAAEVDERGPMGLLKRLTNSLGRKEEEPARLQPVQPREPKLQPAPEARRLPSQDPQLYAPRRGQLDDLGRLAPQSRAVQEDDQLEIPAFLRRQAN
ncbi:MAG: cell division protein FtsZ, partial [Mesorhizobium sp.]|nr:cell division protein FtsZ [Mesorhizobium sp.]